VVPSLYGNVSSLFRSNVARLYLLVGVIGTAALLLLLLGQVLRDLYRSPALLLLRFLLSVALSLLSASLLVAAAAAPLTSFLTTPRPRFGALKRQKKTDKANDSFFFGFFGSPTLLLASALS
jgi:hypothetical protein